MVLSRVLLGCVLVGITVPPLWGQEVTLPLAGYEALRERARLTPVEPPLPAVPFALESADLEVVVGHDSARIEHQLVLTVFSEKWQQVAVGEAGSFVAADLGKLAGRLDAAEQKVNLRVRGKGRHRVRLESVLAIEADDDATRRTRRLRLQAARAAVVRGLLRTDSEVEEVKLEGGGAVERRGDGVWSFIAKGGSPLTFILHGRRQTPKRALLPLRFDATSVSWANVYRDRMRVHGLLKARIHQGRLETLNVGLPADAQVANVDGAIAGFDVIDGQLQVALLAPAEQTFQVEIELVMPVSAEVTSPMLEIENSQRTRFLTAVSVKGDGLLELVDARSLRAATATETASLPAELLKARRFFSVQKAKEAPRWRVEWADSAEVLAAQVDRLLVDVAVGESGRAAYQLWAEVRTRGVRSLAVQLPEGFELIEARRDGEAVIPGRSGQALAIPLGAHSRWIRLSGLLPLTLPQKGQLSLPLPSMSAPAARVEVRAILPGSSSYSLEETRVGSVGRPPSGKRDVSELRRSNFIVGQMVVLGTEVTADYQLWPQPSGYRALEASWSALSSSPGPLVIRVDEEKGGAEWF